MKASKREKQAHKARRKTTEPIGLTASSYVWGEDMLLPLIEWAKHMGYTFHLYAVIEEGNPNVQVVFKTSRKHMPHNGGLAQ